MGKKLIVNADDYGHTPGISAGIRQAHLRGIVTSTTAMMNRPETETALVAALEKCPRLGLGVHLMLTAGKPLLPAPTIPGLVDENGNFCTLENLVSGLDTLDLAQVEAEWSAQIDKFTLITRRKPDHLDAHHHAAYFTPGLFGLLTRLANQLGCPIRKPCSGSTEDAALYLPPALQHLTFPGYLRLPVLDAPRTTDRFIGNFYSEGATLKHLLDILNRIEHDPDSSSFELMCHPALPDQELARISDYHQMRGTELVLLTDQRIRNAIHEAGIELISFGELQPDS